MNTHPKNSMINETEKNNDSKNEISTPKNKDSNLFSFLPKEIVEELESPETLKTNSNSTKTFSNYSDIPEYPKITQKSQTLYLSPDSRKKFRNLVEQKQIKQPSFSGIYSNSDNTMNNSNIIYNTQMFFNQNEVNNNLEQLKFQNAVFSKKFSDSISNNSGIQNVNNMNNMNFNNLNNNIRSHNNYSNINMQINVNNIMNNIVNMNRINNMSNNFSMQNLNNNLNTNLNNINSMSSQNINPNLHQMLNINNINNMNNFNTNDISNMLKLNSDDIQKKSHISFSNLSNYYSSNNLNNILGQKQYYTDKSLRSFNFNSIGPKSSKNLANLYNNNNNNNLLINNNSINNTQINNNLFKNNNNNNKEIDLNDSQIEFLFSQLNNLPKGVCLLIYLIDQISIPYFIKLIKTIKGSKYLQNILSTNPPKESEIDYITKIICNNYREIMCDYYGNYFLQKFFYFCSLKNRLDIYNAIKKDYIEIANDICGNHSLQCLISLQYSNEERKIIQECIQNNLKNLCFGCNSSHVISKIISCLSESDRQYINTFIVNNLMELCMDPNGICIVKEFILNARSNFYIKLLISFFEKETEKLTVNQFGNFVIQEAIKVFGYNYCKKIIDKLLKKIVSFSVLKFSSNVIDFLLDYLSKHEFTKFCKALKKIFLNENNFKEMIKNKFSIYVIENSLDLLIKINENYFENYAKNVFSNQKDESESDSSDSEEELVYEKFLKLKKQIFQFIENNSAAKEKKKILVLIKANKNKNS